MDAVSLALADTSAFVATNLVNYRNSDIVVSPGRDFRPGQLQDIFTSRIAVRGGRTFRVAATSYDMRQNWQSSPTLFSADGAGSLLDLSSLQSITAWGGDGAAWTYSITAENNGTIDLSGLVTVVGWYRGAYNDDDWLVFNARKEGSLRLPSLRTIYRKTRWNLEVPVFSLPSLETASDSQFYLPSSGRLELPVARSIGSSHLSLGDGAVLNAPSLGELQGSSLAWGFNSTFNAPQLESFPDSELFLTPGRTFISRPFTNIYAARLSVSGGRTFRVAATSYDMRQNWQSSPTLFSADGAGSLLDLSSLQSITAWGGDGAAWTYSITAENNGTIDLSGLVTVVGCYRGAYNDDDWLRLRANGGGLLRIGSPVLVRRVGVEASGSSSRVQSVSPRFQSPAQVSISGRSIFEVQGDLAFENTDPNEIVIEGGFLQMDGSLPQKLEVGGRDLGPGGSTARNFGVSQLVVGEKNRTSVIRLVDEVNNGQRGGGGDPECLYLYGLDGTGLRLLHGSRLILNGVKAYGLVNGTMQSLAGLVPAGVNSVPYGEGFIALSGGPRIIAVTPSASVRPSVSSVDLTFDIPIIEATFSAADVTITGPNGVVPVTSVARVTGNTTYRVAFAAQSTDGPYAVRIGPAVDELAGNLSGMDQDQDGLSGEAGEDAFLGSLTIDGTAPLIIRALAPQNGTWVGVTFDEPVDPATATNAANYRVEGLVPVQVSLAADRRTVALEVSPLFGEHFEVSVTPLADSLGNTADRTFTGTLLGWRSADIGTPGVNPVAAIGVTHSI